jgi:hypothetical protein
MNRFGIGDSDGVSVLVVILLAFIALGAVILFLAAA